VPIYASGCSDMDLDNKIRKVNILQSSLAQFNVHDIYTMYKRVLWTSVRRARDRRYRPARLNIRLLLVPNLNGTISNSRSLRNESKIRSLKAEKQTGSVRLVPTVVRTVPCLCYVSLQSGLDFSPILTCSMLSKSGKSSSHRDGF